VALHALNVPRHHLVISTKLFWGKSENIPNTRGLSRKHIIEGLSASLKRLDYDYVDIILCHRPDSDVPMEEICRAFDWVIRKGWAFYWGTSEWNQDEIAEAHYVCDKYSLVKPVVEQAQYNIFQREKLELGYKKLFEKKLLGTTIWSPLAGGVLTGKYNNGIPEGTRYDKNPDLLRIFQQYFSEDKKEKTIKALNEFKVLADELECSQAQLAMAWAISNPDVSTAITGATRPEQLVETVKALAVVPKLTKEVLQRIEVIFGSEPVGKRNMKDFQPEKSRRREVLNY
jgi:voltage-dependent potassium channel beta subunit